MAGYFRFQAYAMRVALVVWWVLMTAIPASWYFDGMPFPAYWWVLPVAGIPMTALFWGISVFMLKTADRK
jgi:hypothetical protein